MTCVQCGRSDGRIRRGLCNACYQRRRRSGMATRTTLPSAYVVSEWAWLSSFGIGRDRAAAQLGMSRKAFDKAIARHEQREHAA